jgi:hypothetical protein
MPRPHHTADMQDNVISIKFSDNRIPEFKEVRGEDYIRYGEDDKFPEHLLMLFNKSAKHNAIINGKVNYILGGGLESDVQDAKTEAFLQELSKVDTPSITDIELYGGFAWEIIPNRLGVGFTFHHISFKNLRASIDGESFLYKKDWSDRSETAKPYLVFKRGLNVPSIFYWKEYRPGCKRYPLPGYVASLNWIEADVEVSKHTLTNAQTGFSSSKLISFFNGEPTPEGKKDITRRFELTATGSEGKKLLLSFNNANTTPPKIDDLGVSDLTKEDFSHVDTLITNNIFAGAQITHPLLFGIQQEGKLGGATELREAFEIFKNTYVSAKQKAFEEIVNFFASLKGITAKFKLKDVEPIGIQFSEATILAVAPRSWILEKMGIDPALYPDAAVQGTPSQPEVMGAEVNQNVKDLTAKQHQQLNRVIRQFTKGQLTKEAASILLRSGLGFSDEEIEGLLGKGQGFAADDVRLAAFESHGETKETYEVIRSKAATFDADDEAFELSQAFDDDRNAPETEGAGVKPPKKGLTPPTTRPMPKYMIRYSYEVRDGEGPELLPTSRSFCVKMVAFSKFYSRQDIQKISALLGYNVFERVGGYWNDNGVIKKHCRHEWKANIVVRK